ncbi:MAG: four-carbon acid sugar kinase family protein [Bryobacteraceae bacterium]|nr:four-carbon acid sugar kinase family protein [Bryobacteraceae bacterium]
MRRILVLADDLTGALECGALLEGSIVTLSLPASAPAAVVDTETRHAPPQQAAETVRRLTEQSPAEMIYKKTDSTLRGNIGAELAALPPGRIHYAPAYPQMGRTVRGGRLLVDGVPVEQTAFARDPLDPVLDSDIRRVLARQGAPLERITVHEGETEADVERAAACVLAEAPPRLAAGPAALLAVLARRMGLARTSALLPRIGHCLVINGSAHPASRAQMAAAEAAGVFDERWRAGTVEDARNAAEALAVFGGDTAREVLRRFGDPPLHPAAEPMPGVVLSWFEACGRRWWLITKAGGFGRPDLLPRLKAMLAGGAAG